MARTFILDFNSFGPTRRINICVVIFPLAFESEKGLIFKSGAKLKKKISESTKMTMEIRKYFEMSENEDIPKLMVCS